MPNFTKRSNARGPAKYRADATAVRGYCDYLEKRVDHQTRYRIHDIDERIWRLEKYTLEELRLDQTPRPSNLWPSFTSNGPRTYWNAIRKATTSNPPRMRIRLPGQVDIEQGPVYDAMLVETERHERFAYGLWHSVDEYRVRRGQLPFQDQLAFLLGVRGGAFIRPWLEEESPYPFQVPLWDPITVAYEIGQDGLDFVCHHYQAAKDDVIARYSVDKDDEDHLGINEEGNVYVYDAWWLEHSSDGKTHVWNLVTTAGGHILLDPYEWRELDHLPCYLIRTFGPDVESAPWWRVPGQRTVDTWETIYTANRDIYPWINRVLTLQALYLRNNAIGPWVATNTGFTDEQLKLAMQPFNIIQTRNPDAKIVPLQPPQMAKEVNEFFGFLTGAEQRGSVPNSIFGDVQAGLSGFAINQLQGAVSMTASQMTKMMEWCYRLATDELIQQFRQRGKRVSVAGMDTRRQQFMVDIKRADLRDKYFLAVEMEPELPTDRLQEAQVAQAWKQAGIDPVTILDEVLKVADPREVFKRMLAWQELQAQAQLELQAASAPPPPGPPGPDEAGGGPMAGMSPEVLPPEAAQLLQQHAQPFVSGPQQAPMPTAAGFAGP